MTKVLYSCSLIFILFILLSNKSAGQIKTDEWLQIDVADTSEITPDEVVLAIVFPEDDDINPAIPKKTVKETNALLIQKVKKIANKYTTDTLLKRETYLNNNFFGEHPMQLFTLSFQRSEKLKLFMTELSDISRIKTFIFQLKSNKTGYYDKELFKKVLDKARKEADFIAEQANKKIINITELKTSYDSEEKGEWVSYPPLSMIASYKSINMNEKIILVKKITVKFNWQDK